MFYDILGGLPRHCLMHDGQLGKKQVTTIYKYIWYYEMSSLTQANAWSHLKPSVDHANLQGAKNACVQTMLYKHVRIDEPS